MAFHQRFYFLQLNGSANLNTKARYRPVSIVDTAGDDVAEVCQVGPNVEGKAVESCPAAQVHTGRKYFTAGLSL